MVIQNEVNNNSNFNKIKAPKKNNASNKLFNNNKNVIIYNKINNFYKIHNKHYNSKITNNNNNKIKITIKVKIFGNSYIQTIIN